MHFSTRLEDRPESELRSIAFDIVDRRRVLILNSDSHKANKRLFRHLHHFVESNEGAGEGGGAAGEGAG